MEESIKEEWRSIEGYDYYQVSSLGRVKSLDKIVSSKGGTRMCKGKILKPNNDNGGYSQIGLHKGGKQKIFLVHRLVAMAFPEICGEYKKGLVVDHINTVRTDNRAINLKWCTPKENNNNPLTLQRYSNANKGENHPMYGKYGKDNPNSIPIIQYDIQGNFIAEHDSAASAEQKLGIHSSLICRVLKGQIRHTHGYIFRYKEEYQNKAI